MEMKVFNIIRGWSEVEVDNISQNEHLNVWLKKIGCDAGQEYEFFSDKSGAYAYVYRCYTPPHGFIIHVEVCEGHENIACTGVVDLLELMRTYEFSAVEDENGH